MSAFIKQAKLLLIIIKKIKSKYYSDLYKQITNKTYFNNGRLNK